MRKQFILLFLVTISIASNGQTLEDFEKDFTSALDTGYSEAQLNKLFISDEIFLTPHSDVTQLELGLKGESMGQYPLREFRNSELYKNNIDKLLASQNPNQRILSYLVIASSGDISYENKLLNKLKIEKNEGGIRWCGMALMYLNTSHTTPLFDFLVEHEDFGDAHMLPLYIKLNKDSLQNTAYHRINSANITAKILAAQILSVTPKNDTTGELLKKAVKDWNIDIKGYAIYSLYKLQIGNLLPILKPLLDSVQTHKIALQALANSPKPNDRNYLVGLVNKKDTVPNELLDCFYKSSRIDNIKYWLDILCDKRIPKKYYFFAFEQPLLSSDTILPFLQDAILKIKNPNSLTELSRALKGRTDERSTTILMGLLANDSEDVRFWAAKSLIGNHTEKLKQKLPDLLNDIEKRVPQLTDLAINNNLNNLHAFYVNMLNTTSFDDWKSASISYLATFPIESDRNIFRAVLSDTSSNTSNGKENYPDFMDLRNAALGLGRLKDESSSELIIQVCERESKSSDFNAQQYLIALGMIKGDAAKKELEKFQNCKDQGVRELVSTTLKNW
jgi:hypothetical protein